MLTPIPAIDSILTTVLGRDMLTSNVKGCSTVKEKCDVGAEKDRVSKGNKENVVAGMANLSIADDVGSKKLAGGSNKPNGEYSRFEGGVSCQSVFLSALLANSAFEAGMSYGDQHLSTHNHSA